MLTESSKPTMAKKASVVAAITGQNALPSAGVLNSVMRERRPARADRPQADDDDDQQAGELDAGEHDIGLHALADAAEIDDRDNRHEGEPDQRDADAAREVEAERAVDRLAAKAREAVEAEVMPEHITAKATMKVTKWMPKALCV